MPVSQRDISLFLCCRVFSKTKMGRRPATREEQLIKSFKMLQRILGTLAGVLSMISSYITIIHLPLPLKVFDSNRNLRLMLLMISWLLGLQMYHLGPKKNYIFPSPGTLLRLWLTSLPLHITTRSFLFRHLDLISPISQLNSASRKSNTMSIIFIITVIKIGLPIFKTA